MPIRVARPHPNADFDTVRYVSTLLSVIAPLLAGPVPLDTLPGWPVAPDVTLVQNLVWILFLPLAVFVVVAVIHMVAARGKEDSSLHPPTELIKITDGRPQAPAVTSGTGRSEHTGGTHALH